jgi:hypothetical protein
LSHFANKGADVEPKDKTNCGLVWGWYSGDGGLGRIMDRHSKSCSKPLLPNCGFRLTLETIWQFAGLEWTEGQTVFKEFLLLKGRL